MTSVFNMKSVIADFASAMGVQYLIPQSQEDPDALKNKAILSLAYAVGRIVYDYMKTNVLAVASNTSGSGLMAFVIEVALTSLLFYGVGYFIGYPITVTYAIFVGLGSASLSDRLETALQTSISV